MLAYFHRGRKTCAKAGIARKPTISIPWGSGRWRKAIMEFRPIRRRARYPELAKHDVDAIGNPTDRCRRKCGIYSTWGRLRAALPRPSGLGGA